MAFFPRNVYNSDASLTPIFRLLDDFDSYARQGQSARRSATPQWQPKFDVREVADAYELHGELPGINKENVTIEFTEPQTLLIRGKSERSYTSGTSPVAPADTTVTGANNETEEEKISLQATVEDEFESISRESGSSASNTPASSPKLEAQKSTTTAEKKAADKAKYWLTERSIGEFNRSFNFPSRVEQDEVSASFKDGILTVTVPKAKKHESRRIIVN